MVATDITDQQGNNSSLDDDNSSALLDTSEDEDVVDDDVEVDVENDDGDVLSELIDIREPLKNLKRGLEKKVGYNLKNFQFWLQDSQALPDSTTLVDQCIQGEGLVQINVEIVVEANKINIVDVLKPADEVLKEHEKRRKRRYSSSANDDEEKQESQKKVKKSATSSSKSEPLKSTSSSKTSDNVTRWVVSTYFRKEQERLKFPTDPMMWDPLHVDYWINWVMKEFSQASIDINDWRTTNGKALCSMSHDDFRTRVPSDPGDLVWTHLELLRKCKFVAIIQKGKSQAAAATTSGRHQQSDSSANVPERKTQKKAPVRLGSEKFSVMSQTNVNNGQVQLWQFLLELLTDKEFREVIHWVGDDGEFKLENPEVVAKLWGVRKNKPTMNYEKLSRALRYYYEGDMISKVHGKRFAYKFVCNLKQLIGYDASELNRLVIEAEQKALGSITIYNNAQ